MSILLNRESRVLVQGMTGSEGTFHTQQMLEFGTQVVAGVSPGKGGSRHLGLPVFDSVAEAVGATGANVAGVFVPRHSRPTPSWRAPPRGWTWWSASPNWSRSTT
ncbi:CoA-binding domain protein [mine drainage metagenome]|uniref:CoA-binding domain protein n=1 Tax=mine drainage metagenome TaxID=410659 RepID=T1CJ11_9ZZZZ